LPNLLKFTGCFLAWAACASGQVELRIEFPALERMLASQVFTQDGRKYVKGKTDDACNYAYLENPKVGVEKGRLRIQSKFGGRTGFKLVKCLSIADLFDVTILATPQYKDGFVVFKDVMVESYGKDTFYRRAIRTRMAGAMESTFRYPLSAEVKRILEQTRASKDYQQLLSNFHVTSIWVALDAIVLQLQFRLTVR
jgi:hypothetical protein